MVETSDKIDMSLDDIIKRDGIPFNTRRRGSSLSNRSRTTFRRSFGGRIGDSFGRNRPTNGRKHSSEAYSRPKKTFNLMSGRLIISNLAYTVTDEDLTELFLSFGPLKKCCVHYDAFGYSLGTAEVVFELKFDAIKAVDDYNGVPLDGRPMRIRLIGGNAAKAWPSGDSRGRATSRGQGSSHRSNVTAEELDKELDSWKMETE